MSYKVEIRPDYDNKFVDLIDLTNNERIDLKTFFMPIYEHKDIFNVIKKLNDLKFDKVPIIYKTKTFKKTNMFTGELEKLTTSTNKQVLSKDAAIKIGDYLGCSFIKWKKKWNAVQFDLWITPIRHHVDRFAFNRQRIPKREHVGTIWELKEILDECLEKNFYNVSPFVFYFKKDPQQLKEYFGKANWKIICKNSFSRNKLLAKTVYERFRGFTGESVDQDLFGIIKNVPSTALKYYMNIFISNPQQGVWVVNNVNVICDNTTFRRLSNLYRDTYSMSRQIDGEKFNPKWSKKKMQEKHDQYQKIIDAKEKGVELFPFVDHICNYLEFKGFEAHLLKNGVEVGEEGRKMRHCVGMYHRYCYSYDKVVYSITKDGERYSTLSFKFDKKQKYDIKKEEHVIYRIVKKDQHYKMQNKTVDDKFALKLEELLKDKLNEQLGVNINQHNDHNTYVGVVG